MFYYCSFFIYFRVCLLLFRLTLFIFFNWLLFTFLVHQVSHVTPFIPPVDFDLDTLAWEVTSRLGLYIRVSDWSWHTFGVCVWFIFSSGIDESLFIFILCLVVFWFVDTSVLKKKKKKKQCDDKFVYSSVFHRAFIDIWGLFIELSMIELVCEPFKSIPLLMILMFLEWQQFGESFMRSFILWIRVDIH